jgi:hypothetical protein
MAKHNTARGGGPLGLARAEKPCPPNAGSSKTTIYINGGPRRYYGIKDDCSSRYNDFGALEMLPNANPDGTLCVKALGIQWILKAGGSFRALPGFTKTRGATRRCGGTGYLGWNQFGSIPAAIDYLRKWFDVRACDTWTQKRLAAHGVPNVPL